MAATRQQSQNGAAKIDASTRILVLHGKEQMLKRLYLQQLRDAMEQTEGEVDSFTFDGRSAELAAVLDELRGYSLMQSYKLVIVDDADTFVKTNRQALERYAQQPVDHATLVMRAAMWNKGNLDKEIAKVGAIIKCDPPKENDAVTWVKNRAKQTRGRSLNHDAAGLMVERLGTDLSLLDSELGKLALLGEAGAPIQRADVEAMVGRSSDEQAYAAQEALLSAMQSGSSEQALRTVRELIELAGQPETLVMYFACDLFRKLTSGASLKQAGWGEKEIAKQLRLPFPIQRSFFNALKGVDQRTLRSLFDQALQFDSRSKSGLGDAKPNLERFCVAAVEQTRSRKRAGR